MVIRPFEALASGALAPGTDHAQANVLLSHTYMFLFGRDEAHAAAIRFRLRNRRGEARDKRMGLAPLTPRWYARWLRDEHN